MTPLLVACILSAVNWKANDWSELPNYAQAIKNITNQQNPGMYGSFAVLGPSVANNIADAGYDTVDKLTKYVTDTGDAAPKPKFGGFGSMPPSFHVVVTGSSNNNYWMIGGMAPGRQVNIDDWR